MSQPISKELDLDSVEVIFPPVVFKDQTPEEDEIVEDSHEEVDLEGSPVIRPTASPVEAHRAPPVSTPVSTPSSTMPAWRPLLLIVPLRLGLHEINICYLQALKVSLLLFLKNLMEFVLLVS